MDTDQSTATALQAVSAAVNAQSYEQQLNQAVYYQQQHVQAQQQAAHAQAQQQQANQSQNSLLQDEHGRTYTQIVHPNGAISHILHTPLVGFQPVSPPQTDFNSRPELIDYIHKYAKTNGFGIVISHSNDKAIYFTCELGGSYRNKRNITDEKRKRKLNTRKCNCPFAMVANSKRDETGSGLPNKWTLRVSNNEHNHDKLNLNEDYPSLRRRNPDVNAMIRELYLQGEKPSVIESKLKSKFEGILINREDIYNETRKMKREERLKREGIVDTSLPSIHNLSGVVNNNATNGLGNNNSSNISHAQVLSNVMSVDPMIHATQHTLNQLHAASNSSHQNNQNPNGNNNTMVSQSDHTNPYDAESLPSILQAQLNQMYDHNLPTRGTSQGIHENHQQLSQLSDLAVDGYASHHNKDNRINEHDIDANIDSSLGMK